MNIRLCCELDFCCCSSPAKSPGLDSGTMLMNNVYRERFPKVSYAEWINVHLFLVVGFFLVAGDLCRISEVLISLALQLTYESQVSCLALNCASLITV